MAACTDGSAQASTASELAPSRSFIFPARSQMIARDYRSTAGLGANRDGAAARGICQQQHGPPTRRKCDHDSGTLRAIAGSDCFYPPNKFHIIASAAISSMAKTVRRPSGSFQNLIFERYAFRIVFLQ